VRIERMSVGLDVHARSVFGCAIDGETGEIHRRRLGPAPAGILAWVAGLPTPEQEAARDLVRARDDARRDLMRTRHRLSKLLLRHGQVYSGGQAWKERCP
jgi:hypothetical protein